MIKEKETAFLAALSELSRQHGVIIQGCGCCGSPSLAEIKKARPDDIDYTEIDGHYDHDDGCDVKWVKNTQ